jgi:outer membrane lipoprotein carrier protein
VAVEVALALAFTMALPAAAASPKEAEDALALARRIQARHQTIRDMKARFTQTYVSTLLGRQVVEHGTLAVKRPGRMRWEYQEPEKKLFVSDGKTSYFYVPSDKQVIVHEATGDRGVALQLLSGRSDLLAEFQVFAVPHEASRVHLVPRKADAEIKEAEVEADADGRIRRLEVLDLQGNRSEFRFDDVKEDVGLSDRLFQFEIPKGVEVVQG